MESVPADLRKASPFPPKPYKSSVGDSKGAAPSRQQTPGPAIAVWPHSQHGGVFRGLLRVESPSHLLAVSQAQTAGGWGHYRTAAGDRENRDSRNEDKHGFLRP